ncbi:GNAT family N-acetyltransferase [Bradyrhizobium sp. SYSU BS000235]|uniref:GNAT family N-acetyltransferase n=1 Tax=Bradyrhizobium sp. SYSU BS000235 TaxID=3411332 RepID=UPI003C77347E
MGQALPKVGLRPFLPADTSVLAAIFVASVEELTEDDYSEAQREAWAGAAEDEEKFGKRLAGQLTLVATIQGSPAGFISVKGNDHIDLLYVHPRFVRQGVATALCDAIEKLSAARGVTGLNVESSDTAEPFFARRGYVSEQRNTVSMGDEWLTNTTMKKVLGDNGPQSEAPGRPS